VQLKERLDAEVLSRNVATEISQEKLDPIIVAHRYRDESISLICALFSYGNVKQIVKFLDSLDFSLLDQSEIAIQEGLRSHYYRFQKSEDIIALFIALKRLNQESSLESLFLEAYQEKRSVVDGVNRLIETLQKLYPHQSRGYTFLLSKVSKKRKGSGALKRWMMYLRWMVRDDFIDMGLWRGVEKADLIMPLDTHTYHTGLRLGLLKRKSYDLEAAFELTERLRAFDANDPLKYDFALYRIGQEKIL